VKLRKLTLMSVVAALMVTSMAVAQSNPCNPCGGKKKGMSPCNPCGHKKTMFHVGDARNSVVFKSSAPLEDIVGITSDITGHISFDPKDSKKGVTGELTISLASFNTGIPMRDGHLSGSDWLDAKQFPNITLKILSVKNIREVKSSASFQTYAGDVVAELNFHGRTKKITFPGKLTYLKESEQTKTKMPGDLVAAKAEFSVLLADYDITGPKGMNLIGSKVGESIDIEVSFMGTNAMTAMAENPCDPCGGKKGMNPCNPCNPCGGKKKDMNPCNPCDGK